MSSHARWLGHVQMFAIDVLSSISYVARGTAFLTGCCSGEGLGGRLLPPSVWLYVAANVLHPKCLTQNDDRLAANNSTCLFCWAVCPAGCYYTHIPAWHPSFAALYTRPPRIPSRLTLLALTVGSGAGRHMHAGRQASLLWWMASGPAGARQGATTQNELLRGVHLGQEREGWESGVWCCAVG